MVSDALVEKITQEVLQVYKSTLTPSAAPEPAKIPARPFEGHPLVGVCGNPLGREETARAWETIRKTAPRVKALLSPQAGQMFRDARRIFGGFTVDPAARDYAETLGRFSHLVVLNVSVNYTAKLALLLADTPLTVAAFEFLRAGKSVTLCTASLVPYLGNPAIRTRVEGYLATLRTYGIAVEPGWLPGDESPGARAAGKAPPPGLSKAECTGCPVVGQCASHCDNRVKEFLNGGADRVGATPGLPTVSSSLAGVIDHTLLKPDATDADIRKLCEEARKYVFASVCVNPSKVKLSAELLRGSPVKVCTVVGFPLGATTSVTKAMETRDAIANGADEIDMVINVGALKAKDYDRVREDIEAVVQAAGDRLVKVILETSLLDDDEKVMACKLAKQAKADFVKTSTGFGGGGATVHDIELMRRTVGPTMGVKASGGVRDFDTARAMVEAGATRIGASASVAIVQKGGPAAKSGY